MTDQTTTAADVEDDGCPHCGDHDPDHCWTCGNNDCTAHTEED
jgi:hypothetical protein